MAALAAVVIIVAGCGLFGSPTSTFKAFFEASKKKDVEAMRKTLSKGTLDLLEKSAKSQNKSVDDLLREMKLVKEGSAGAVPETRNEKIDGDTATLEIKDEKGDWETLPFVKEDGSWKIAFDKFVEDLMKKLKDKVGKP